MKKMKFLITLMIVFAPVMSLLAQMGQTPATNDPCVGSRRGANCWWDMTQVPIKCVCDLPISDDFGYIMSVLGVGLIFYVMNKKGMLARG